MNIADKIMCLRKQKGWSQEELAMRLDVSRQSVSKWEVNQSIPDMNKILALSELFDVTTDYLLKEELTEEHANLDEDELKLIVPKAITNSQALDYLEAMKRFSKRIAFGVLLCILGAAFVVFFSGTADINTVLGSEQFQMVFGLLLMFILVAVAVGIFITSSNKINEYDYISKSVVSIEKKTKENLIIEYRTFKKKYNVKMALSVVLLILGVVPLIVAAIYEASDYVLINLVVLLLVFAMISIFTLVKESLEDDGYKNLLNKGDNSKQSQKIKRKIESINGIYWPLIVAIYLGWSFYTHDWHITWIVWPIAGLVSSIIPEIIKLKNQ